MTERTYDWVPRHDERNIPFRLTIEAVEPRSKNWRVLPRLDQGSEGACVGFGWSAAIGGFPRPKDVSNASALDLYEAAKFVDEWEGEDYDGTSVLAGAKAARNLGAITSYSWAFSVQDIVNAVAWQGPVVFGCWWYDGMEDTDEDGYITPWGQKLGGHCVCIHGVNLLHNRVRIRNSWGKGWGFDGDCWLTLDHLGLLLDEDGEACVPVKP